MTRSLLDELVLTAAARGETLELARGRSGMTVARIGVSAGIGATPIRALEALADVLGTPAVLRAVHTISREQLP